MAVHSARAGRTPGRTPGRVTGRALGLALAISLLQGCAGAGPEDRARDPLDAPVYTLVEAFRLGGTEPSEPEMFDARPVLAVDDAGHLHVLHRRQGRVAVFDQDGGFLHWIGGGRGQGPGEFNSPVRMGLLGDTIWIRNVSPPRITLFRTDGTMLRTDPVLVGASPGLMSGTQGISGYLAGGRAWVEPDSPPTALEEGMTPESSLALGSRQPEGPRDTVLSWRSNRGRLGGLVFDPIPEPPFFAVAADGSGIVVAEWSDEHPDRLRLRVLNPDGSTRWEDALAVVPRPIPADEHHAIIREGRDRVGEMRERLLGMGLSPEGAPRVPTEAEARELIHLPAHRPPVRAVQLAIDGAIWLNLAEPGSAEPGSAETWLAIHPDEGILFRIDLPEGARLGQGSRDAVWYAEEDELGVTWVVHARLEAAAEPADRNAGS